MEHRLPRPRNTDLLGLGKPTLSVVRSGLYTGPIFSTNWSRRLLEELDHIEEWALKTGCTIPRPNSMNEYGVVLDDFGWTTFFERALDEVINPLVSPLFPEVIDGRLRAHHAFIVHYAQDRDIDLGFHVDESDVTINLCLEEAGSGSMMTFEGRRCFHHLDTPVRDHEFVEYEHRQGIAIVHAGKERHRVAPIEMGVRRNLILWCRSHADEPVDFGACPTWCGAHEG